MARMRIEIDQEMLARAGELLGTTNRKDIVDTALRVFIANRQADDALRRQRDQERADALDQAGAFQRRVAALERLKAQFRDGAFDDDAAQQRRSASWEQMRADYRAGKYDDVIAYRNYVKAWR